MKFLPYSGIVILSGSKSILQRYLFIASLFPVRTILKPGSCCEDVMEMAEAARQSGAKIEITADAIRIDSTKVNTEKLTEVRFTGSATALRFWMARALFVRAKTVIEVSQQLCERPVIPFLDELQLLGCKVDMLSDNSLKYCLRIEIMPPEKVPAEVDLDADVSSQFISGLMLAGALAKDCFTMKFRQTPVSYPYLKLTENLMKEHQVNVSLEGTSVLVQGGEGYHFKRTTHIEPELSGGAFFLALSAFTKSRIIVANASEYHLQPDWEIIPIMLEMGVRFIEIKKSRSMKARKLIGLERKMQDYPDLIPLVAVLALFADSPSVISEIDRIKFKESDRVNGILQAFEQIGAGFIYAKGCLKIYPYKSKPPHVTLDTQNDHRLVIAFTLLKLHYPQIELSETDSVRKSCPEFFQVLETLKQKS